jgi:ABC-type lipopolysaccharide export system ATPase subunit
MPVYIDTFIELIQSEKNNKGFLITDHMYKYITEISDSLYVIADNKTHLTKSDQDIVRLKYVRAL